MGEPDPFRLRYRQSTAELIGGIVSNKMNKKTAVEHIWQYAAEHIPANDRARFTKLVEADLIGLHEGNIARYRFCPSQYQSWKANLALMFFPPTLDMGRADEDFSVDTRPPGCRGWSKSRLAPW